jgi:hypothetical protein
MTAPTSPSRRPTLADRLLKAAGLPNINARQYGVRDLLIEASRALAHRPVAEGGHLPAVIGETIVRDFLAFLNDEITEDVATDRFLATLLQNADAIQAFHRGSASPAAPGDAVGATAPAVERPPYCASADSVCHYPACVCVEPFGDREPEKLYDADDVPGPSPEPTDADLVAVGYAPGNYMSRCLHCGAHPTDVQKRATSCRPCAVKRFKARAALAAQPAPEKSDGK